LPIVATWISNPSGWTTGYAQLIVNPVRVAAVAPVGGMLRGVASLTVAGSTPFASLLLYIVIPVILAQLVRRALLARGPGALDAGLTRMQPWSIAALLATLVLIFAFQGEAVIRQPLG